MDKFTVLNRKKKIEKELQRIRLEEKIWNKELRVLQKECNHEITITVMNHFYLPKTRTYCLFCGLHVSPRKYMSEDLVEKLEKSVNVDISSYPTMVIKMEELYKGLKAKGKDKTEYEIGKEMAEMLKGEK